MKQRVTWWFLLLAGIVVPVMPLFARQITMEVQPGAIRLNETATLKLNFINLNPPQAPALPAMPGFRVQYVGQEQHFQFANGQQERRLTYNYQLQPESTGTFQIGPFTLDMNGQKIEIPAAGLEVLPPSGRPDGQQQTLDDMLFARFSLPRKEFYLHERFNIEVALYYRGLQLHREVQFQNLPATGLNLENFAELNSNREVVNNEIFEVRRFRMQGVAIASGEVTLDPLLRVHVLVERERQRDPFFGGFDDFFFGRHSTQPVSVAIEPVDLTIRPLPAEGRPANFSGAVGRFNVDMSVQPSEVTAGEPVTLTLRITGMGNFENISMPAFDFGPEFRAYDPKLTSTGRDHRAFEQVFIPRSDRVTEIPPADFTYFNPEQGAYQTITRGPFPLLVKAGEDTDLQLVQAPSAAAAPDRAPLGIDILDVKRSIVPSSARPGESHSIQPWLHLTPLLALAGLMVVQRRRQSFQGDVSRQRRAQAPRSARNAIKKAETALADKNSAALHEAIWQALADYMGHRCNVQAGEVTPEWITAKCRVAGLREIDREKLDELLRCCDEARFARMSDAESPEKLKDRLEQARELLRAMEKVRL